MAKRVEVDVEAIRMAIEGDKLTQLECAKLLGTTDKVVWSRCKQYGIKTQHVGIRKGTMLGDKAPNWKGGRIRNSVYWMVFCPGHPHARGPRKSYVMEHRLVMEKHLGRYLDPKEVVHHIDGNPRNNDISNLKLYDSNGSHKSDAHYEQCRESVLLARKRHLHKLQAQS